MQAVEGRVELLWNHAGSGGVRAWPCPQPTTPVAWRRAPPDPAPCPSSSAIVGNSQLLLSSADWHKALLCPSPSVRQEAGHYKSSSAHCPSHKHECRFEDAFRLRSPLSFSWVEVSLSRFLSRMAHCTLSALIIEPIIFLHYYSIFLFSLYYKHHKTPKIFCLS